MSSQRPFCSSMAEAGVRAWRHINSGQNRISREQLRRFQCHDPDDLADRLICGIGYNVSGRDYYVLKLENDSRRGIQFRSAAPAGETAVHKWEQPLTKYMSEIQMIQNLKAEEIFDRWIGDHLCRFRTIRNWDGPPDPHDFRGPHLPTCRDRESHT